MKPPNPDLAFDQIIDNELRASSAEAQLLVGYTGHFATTLAEDPYSDRESLTYLRKAFAKPTIEKLKEKIAHANQQRRAVMNDLHLHSTYRNREAQQWTDLIAKYTRALDLFEKRT